MCETVKLKDVDTTDKEYSISLDGCDDSTYIEMRLSEDELKLVHLLCKRSEENSDYGCMPTMSVKEIGASEV